MDVKYYDGTKLLSLKDKNGMEPDIYISSSNRLAGKTTFYYRWRVKKFLKEKKKTMWLYRYQSDIDACSDKIFSDIGPLFFEGHEMTYKVRAKGRYADLMLDGTHMGYALPLNSSDAIKNMSHVFCDVDWMLFDEFQPESGKYCKDELTKFQSVHSSVARGGGKQIRRVPVTLIGNFVSLLNPYYSALGISKALRSDTKYYRGDGFVLESIVNDSSAQAQKESAFNRAFTNSTYGKYAAEKFYLNDNDSCIERLSGPSRYLCTVWFNGEPFCIRISLYTNIVYCCSGYDPDQAVALHVTLDDTTGNSVFLSSNPLLVKLLRNNFHLGNFRFEGLKEKECVYKLLSYNP